VLAIVACGVFAACGGTTLSGTAEVRALSAEVTNRSQPLSSVICQDEIRARSVQTAYEAVMRMRPQYLRGGHTDTPERTVTAPEAVIETGMPEPIDALKQIPADAVLEIRFVEPRDAVTLFGARYSGGIVIVRLVKSRRIVDSPI